MENNGQPATSAEPRPGPVRRSSLWASFKNSKPAQGIAAKSTAGGGPGAEQMVEGTDRRPSGSGGGMAVVGA